MSDSKKNMLPSKTVAERLGVSVKTVLAYAKRANSPLPASQYGRDYFFHPADVVKFIENCRVIK